MEMPIARFIPKVRGKNIERAATDVSPGRTPKITPTTTPIKISSRFMGFEKIVANAVPNNSSILVSLYPNNPRGRYMEITLVNRKYKSIGTPTEKQTVKTAQFFLFSAGVKINICKRRNRIEDIIKPSRT